MSINHLVFIVFFLISTLTFAESECEKKISDLVLDAELHRSGLKLEIWDLIDYPIYFSDIVEYQVILIDKTKIDVIRDRKLAAIFSYTVFSKAQCLIQSLDYNYTSRVQINF